METTRTPNGPPHWVWDWRLTRLGDQWYWRSPVSSWVRSTTKKNRQPVNCTSWVVRVHFQYQISSHPENETVDYFCKSKPLDLEISLFYVSKTKTLRSEGFTQGPSLPLTPVRTEMGEQGDWVHKMDSPCVVVNLRKLNHTGDTGPPTVG